jgi:hypothetical protein
MTTALPTAPRPDGAPPPKPAPPASLRRELAAIGVLYLVLSILPLLIGLLFAP